MAISAKKLEIINRLQAIQPGQVIQINNIWSFSGKVFNVRAVNTETRKEHFVKVCLWLLEVGKPETHEVAGVGMAKGKTFTMSNVQYLELYANNSISWSIVE